MKHFVVTWVIDIHADNAQEAAAQALITQRDPESTATFFTVTDPHSNTTEEVDLNS